MPQTSKPLIIAHRGASFDAPENTMTAFDLGWEQGADGVECDVRLTKDGILVCHHDATTKRMTGVGLSISESPYAELVELDLMARAKPDRLPEKIPKLPELLDTIRGERKVFIEIKVGVETVEPLRRDLLESDVEKVIVIAFDAEVIAALKRRIPAVKAYWLHNLRGVGRSLNEATIDGFLDTCQEMRADGMGLRNCSLVSRNLVDRLSNDDLELNIWTVDNIEEAKHYLELGVDSITTNKPGFIRSGIFNEA